MLDGDLSAPHTSLPPPSLPSLFSALNPLSNIINCQFFAPPLSRRQAKWSHGTENQGNLPGAKSSRHKMPRHQDQELLKFSVYVHEEGLRGRRVAVWELVVPLSTRPRLLLLVVWQAAAPTYFY